MPKFRKKPVAMIAGFLFGWALQRVTRDKSTTEGKDHVI